MAKTTKFPDYRGVEIWYDEDDDKFCFSLGEGDNTIKKLNLTGVKKYIDDYLKNNSDFKPFKAFQMGLYNCKPERVVEITGVRKDGNLTYKGYDGKINTISDWYIKDWYYYLEENESVIVSVLSIEAEIDELNNKKKELRKKYILKPLKEK